MSETLQATMKSPLGDILLTANETTVTGIHFCNEPVAAIATDDALLLRAIEELNEYFAGKRMAFTFPMNQPGTEFQQRVWQMLTTIPQGKTISYKTLAIQLGDLKCIRAAGTANGKNQLAIAVPCHRVIGANGDLVGYAGGLWRKKWLLEHEARLSGNAVQTGLF